MGFSTQPFHHRVLRWIETLAQDLRYGARNLRRAPGLVAVSVLSLGLGIGLNLTLYAGVTTIFRHQPTMTDPAKVVGIEPGNGRQFSYQNYRDLRDSGTFSGVVGFRISAMNRRVGDELERLSVLVVTDNFFEGLGIRTRLGRTFSAGEAAPERSPRAIVLDHPYWNARFGADPNAIGQTMILDGEPFTVIGVLPENYRSVTGFMAPSAYVPISALTLPTLNDRGSPTLSVLARLAPGGTREHAQASRDGDRRGARAPVSRDERGDVAASASVSRRCDAVPRHARRVPAVSDRAAGPVRPRIADWIGQCCRPASGACRLPPARADNQIGAWRQPLPRHPDAAVRKLPVVTSGCGRRPCADQHPGPIGCAWLDAPASARVLARSPVAVAGTLSRRADHAPLRCRAGAAVEQDEPSRRAQEGRFGRDRPRQPSQRVHHGSGRLVPHAARGVVAVPPQSVADRGHRSRLRSRSRRRDALQRRAGTWSAGQHGSRLRIGSSNGSNRFPECGRLPSPRSCRLAATPLSPAFTQPAAATFRGPGRPRSASGRAISRRSRFPFCRAGNSMQRIVTARQRSRS